MTFVKFVENRYQELTYLNQTNPDSFSIAREAEIKALQQLLTGFRNFMRWVMIPKCLWDFIGVKCGLKSAPVPVLINKMRDERDAKKVADDLAKASNVTPIQPVSAEKKES